MPRKSMNRNANGAGSIKEYTVERNGKTYHYWRARFTTGFDPGSGKQNQRTITGKTQGEVREAMIR